MSFLKKIGDFFAPFYAFYDEGKQRFRSRKERWKGIEVKPPWVVYPEFPPGDGFWRQAGEGYYAYGWLPYLTSLSPDEKHAYFTRWPVPPEWRDAIA